MLNYKLFKVLPILSFMLLALSFTDKSSASDLSVLDVLMDQVQPNVLIVLDLSGSMAFQDVETDEGLKTRLAVAKEALIEVINDGDNKNMRWGLMTFPGGVDDEGGTLVEECKQRDAAELEAFTNMIKGLQAVGGTPVASAMAEAGLYLAGKDSFFHDGVTYTSPIENVCQVNYIILVTDGNSTGDIGLKGGFRGTVDDRYNLYTRTNDIIFLKNDYINGKGIGNYITDNNLGYKFDDYIATYKRPDNPNAVDLSRELIHEFWFSSDKNPDIPADHTMLPTESGMDFYNWEYIWGGSPPGPNNELRADDVYALAAANQPYVYGYNAANPSLPIPGLTDITYHTTYKYAYIRLSDQGFLQHTQIYWGNVFGDGNFSSDYLDDVAAFLYNEDLRPDLGEVGSKYEKQNAKVFTIGFMHGNDLLLRTAIQGGTGEEGYIKAGNAADLGDALGKIITGIKEAMGVFVAPSVPTANENDVYAGDSMYMGLFKPQAGAWVGNLKRYIFENNTLDVYLNENGTFKDTAQSAWSTVADGGDVAKGGAAEVLQNWLNENGTDARKVYTYIGDGVSTAVTEFNKDNIIASKLNVDEDNRLAVIEKVRSAAFGAVIHSPPTLMHYDNRKTIFVGASDGFLHAVDNDDGKELWVFIMPDHLKTIKLAATSSPSDDVWFVDGSIATRTVDGNKVVIFGSRRGGNTYVALNVSNYDKPSFLYQIPSLTNTAAWNTYNLGLSFSTPKFIKIDGDDVMLLSGGYDVRYDTLSTNEMSALEIKGAAVFGVDTLSGKPIDDVFDKLTSGTSSMFKDSILEVSAYDLNNDNSIDTLYFGDLGSKMFYAYYDNVASSGFVPYLLFDDSDGNSSGRKFWYAPEIIVISGGKEYVYFGSGDRESPLDRTVVNRFYSLHNDPQDLREENHSGAYLSLDDLADVSLNLIQKGSDEDREQAEALLRDKSGWYIELDTGEKVVSSPAIWQGIVMFTTFQAKEESEIIDPDDVCTAGRSVGEARLYAVHYLNGSAALFENNEVSKVIGDSIPSGVTINQFEDGTVTYEVLVGDKDELVDVSGLLPNKKLEIIYWREIF